MHFSYSILGVGVILLSNSFHGKAQPVESTKSFYWLTSSSEKIVGGEECSLSQIPHQVSLQSGDSHFCGGSVISKSCVMTAAHCVRNAKPSSIKIKCGATSLDSPNMETFNVEAIKVHENYNSNTMTNDIAIVKLSGPGLPMETNSNIQEVEIAEEGSEFQSGHNFTTSGFGVLSEGGGDISTRCMCVEVPAVSNEECKRAYGSSKIYDSMICAGVKGKDSCQGDSGGPLVTYDGVTQKWIQTGIVSWGKGCARDEYPGESPLLFRGFKK